MATTYNSGSITYDSGTNTITVIGAKHTGTVPYTTANSEIDFSGTDCFTSENTPAETIGRFIWFYDKYMKDNSLATVDDWSTVWASTQSIEPYVRRIINGSWEDWAVSADYPLGFIPSPDAVNLDNYIIAWNFEDIYLADLANGWGVVTKYDEDNYFINANIVIGDHTTQVPTMLAQFQGTLQLGTAGANNIQIYRYGFFQFGQSFDGLSMGGGVVTGKLGSACGVFGAGIYRMFNSNLMLETSSAFSFTHNNFETFNPYFELQDVTHNAWETTSGGSYYISSGDPYWKNVTYSHTSADQYRAWNTTIRTTPTLDNVFYGFRGSLLYQITSPGVKTITNFIKGGGTTILNVVSYYGSGDSYIRFINPTGLDITQDMGISAHNSGLYLTHIQEAQYYNGITRDADGLLEGALIDLTDVNGNNVFSLTSDVNGETPQQEVVARDVSSYTDLASSTTLDLSPFSLKFLKYGYLPVELQKAFDKAESDTMLLSVDNNITLTLSEAKAISGITLSVGTFTDTNLNSYSYQIDCGNNTLNSVYHYLSAIMYEYDELETTGIQLRTITKAPLITTNGQSFDGFKGFYFINYSGTLNTTTADDGTIFYPEVLYTFQLSGLKAGTEVRIYDSTTLVELAGTESVVGTAFNYTYAYDGDKEVIVVIFALGYQPIRLVASVSNTNSTIPIQQSIDRNYVNIPAPVIPTKDIYVIINSAVDLNKFMIFGGMTYLGESYSIDHITGYSVVTDTAHGTFVDNGDDTYTYTPSASYEGTDTLVLKPQYDETGSYKVEDVTIIFTVGYPVGKDYEKFVIIGASIMAYNGSYSYLQSQYLFQYGKSIEVINKAVGGTTSDVLDANIESIIADVEANNGVTPSNTLFLMHTGGNDLTNNRLSSEPQYTTNMNATIGYIDSIRNKLQLAGYSVSIADLTFRNYDYDNPSQDVYDLDTSTMLNEHLGSKPYNDNGIDPYVNQYNKEFTNDGKSIMQFYNSVRWYRDLYPIDAVHPNAYGLRFLQQQILDTLGLYNATGYKPLPSTIDWYEQVQFDFSNNAEIATDVTGHYWNRYSSSGLTAPVVTHTGNPSNISIAVAGSNLFTSGGMTSNGWTFGNRLQTGLYGTAQFTVTISGLEANSFYKIQGIPSRNVTDNIRVTRFTLQSTGKSVEIDGASNLGEYFDFLLFSETGADEVIIVENVSTYSYLNAMRIYKIADGV